MNYLLDKRNQRKKNSKIALGAVVLVILFLLRFFVFSTLSFVGQGVFRPVLVFGNSIGEKIKSLGSYFVSKNSLYLQNEDLRFQISESAADRANYISIVDENNKMKEILGRKNEKTNMILSAILSKPNQSPYDTLVVDIGKDKALKTGDTVFALGNVPIGRVDMVYDNSSKVVLFSNVGEKTEVVVSGSSAVAGTNAFLELVGRGGGNFEMIMPKNSNLQKGDQVVLPGINPYTLAVVETVISDPRDPYTKILLTSPVNVQELKFVEIEQK